ncbi:ABC transporter permease [Reinekea marinisedimentorum]|uniref:ABC-2 type transport system permease protein n=1 Tax=Reinekea marinisedimentorum TaxID=230495 RepID=A0A4R3HWS4_9GAMM|nr:ABC-2 family transporter protein [Reinekea marinisedimentorum]TCS37588.1 ABC-2 type transport system permease protein [Reinekea marinisedimentorum]
MEWLSLFKHYSVLTIKERFQYKLNAILVSLAVFLREGATIAVIYFMLLRFGSINGWEMYELLFLYSYIFFTYGLFILFFTGLRDFEGLVRIGSFDRYLLRPRGLIFQIIVAKVDWFAAIGHGSLGLLLFLYSAFQVNVSWSAINITYCALAIIGGVLIQAAIFLLMASLSFTFISVSNLRQILYWNTRKFAGYPISIFHASIKILLIYIVPFAFVNYFPSQFLLHKTDMAEFPALYMYIAPAVGFALFGLAMLYWRYSLQFYKSTGN